MIKKYTFPPNSKDNFLNIGPAIEAIVFAVTVPNTKILKFIKKIKKILKNI